MTKPSAFSVALGEGPTDPVVLVERVAPHIALVTLNRPAARNAVNAELALLLEASVRAIEADPEVRVAVLTGAGTQAFCTGADLKEIAAGTRPGARTTPDGGFAGFADAPRRKPWIAAVNGAALAGGLELVLAGDFAIAVEQASFGLPEVTRGLAAAAGGIYRLPRVIPRGMALELIATGDPIDAARACELGLVNRVVAASALRSIVVELAGRIAANAPLAVIESLAVARRAHDFDEAALRRRAQDAAERLLATEDAREGPRAFAERRPPRWVGR